MKTLDEQIAIMTAYKNGAVIERRPKENTIWLHCNKPSWDWERVDYRVVNEPITIDITVNRGVQDAIHITEANFVNADEVTRRLLRGESINLKFREVTDGS